MMTNPATTKMSSKGQVVIPEAIRKTLGLGEGCRFLVVGDKDTVLLKTISAPSKEEFGRLVAKARKEARKVGLRAADIDEAVRKVRGRK